MNKKLSIHQGKNSLTSKFTSSFLYVRACIRYMYFMSKLNIIKTLENSLEIDQNFDRTLALDTFLDSFGSLSQPKKCNASFSSFFTGYYFITNELNADIFPSKILDNVAPTYFNQKPPCVSTSISSTCACRSQKVHLFYLNWPPQK